MKFEEREEPYRGVRCSREQPPWEVSCGTSCELENTSKIIAPLHAQAPRRRIPAYCQIAAKPGRETTRGVILREIRT